jgi:hypothetical protein
MHDSPIIKFQHRNVSQDRTKAYKITITGLVINTLAYLVFRPPERTLESLDRKIEG